MFETDVGGVSSDLREPSFPACSQSLPDSKSESYCTHINHVHGTRSLTSTSGNVSSSWAKI